MRTHALMILLVVGLLTAGCASPAAPTPTASAPPSAAVGAAPAPFPRTITDDAGRQVVLAAAPARIVSIAPSNTEILYALGLGEQVVAVDQFSDYPPEAKQKARLGSYIKPDLEAIVAAAPDLILATGVHVKGVLPALEERRLTVVVLEPRNLAEVFDGLLLVGQATGRSAEATRLVEQLRERSGAVTARVAGLARTRVYVELSPQLHSAGPGSFIDDLLGRVGGENVAAAATTTWPQLSQEALLLSDPQVIVLSYKEGVETPQSVAARPGWQTISAVKAGRVVVIDPDLTSRAGPRVVMGVEALARALHPDRFPEGGRP